MTAAGGLARRLTPTSMIVLALAALLLWLAIPRFIAALYAVPCHEIIDAVERNRHPPLASLRACLPDQQARLRWDGSRTAPAELGLLHDAISRHPELDGSARREHLRQAEKMTALAVSRAPLDTGLWTRLAWLRRALGLPPYKILPALRQATLSASYEPSLTFHRLRLWMALAATGMAFEQDDQRLVARQIRFAVELDPDRLAALADAVGAPPWVTRHIELANADASDRDNPRR